MLIKKREKNQNKTKIKKWKTKLLNILEYTIKKKLYNVKVVYD